MAQTRPYVPEISTAQSNTTGPLNFAASELQEYFGRIFPDGLDEPVRCDLSLAETGIRFDGFSLDIAGGNIKISACREQGLLHGAYKLLELLGCNFMFPGKKREKIPRLKHWPLQEKLVILEQPWLEFRGICLYNTTRDTLRQTLDALDWMAKNRFNFLMTSIHREDDTGCGGHAILWDEIGDALLPEIEKRGITLDMSEHSTDYYFPKETLFPAHPDWFAEIDGMRRAGQICYSCSDAVEAYGDSLAKFVKDKSWFSFFGIWPLDGGGYCECERCKNPGTLFQANERIAAKLKKARPDLTVEHLAYTPRSFARPAGPMPENMSVLVCAKRDKIAYEWARAARDAGGAFYFDYMTADHYRYRTNVWLNPRYCRETVNALVSYGFRGIISLYLPLDCWWQAGINLRFLSTLCYHPDKDVKQLCLETAQGLFGSRAAQEGSEALSLICGGLLEPLLWSGFPHTNEWYCEHITNRIHALDQLHAAQFDREYEDCTEALERLRDIVCRETPEMLQNMDCATASGRPQGIVSAEAAAPKQNIDSAKAAEQYGGQNGVGNVRNLELLHEYIELQRLYFHCIDQYDAITDTPDRAEPYFLKLAELEKQPDSPFISERYARWRITGRDNIFDVSLENLFQIRVD